MHALPNSKSCTSRHVTKHGKKDSRKAILSLFFSKTFPKMYSLNKAFSLADLDIIKE